MGRNRPTLRAAGRYRYRSRNRKKHRTAQKLCLRTHAPRQTIPGDAAHTVPPTGAKGLNLAMSDVRLLSTALAARYAEGTETELDQYSQRALARVWKAERFSWWFTNLTHRFPSMNAFDRMMQIAELGYIRDSRAAQTVLAENYVGLRL